MTSPKMKLPVGELILGGVLILVATGGLALFGYGAQISTEARPSGESAETIGETPAEEEAEQEEQLEPKQERPFPDIVYSGSGDSTFEVELPAGPSSVGIASITHTGSSNFSVWALSKNSEKVELVVDAVGDYVGTVPFSLSNDAEISYFEISTDGPWTVTLKDVLSLEEISQGSPATGEGDEVLLYRGKKTVANVSHEGEGVFSLRAYNGFSSRLLADEIGIYSGQLRWRAGLLMIQVSADGAWRIEPQ